MNRSWVRFPQAAQIRPPGSGWAFLYACLLLCPAGVSGAGGPACGAGLLCVPVGGGPPASRPRRELRSARRLEARPGPATAHGHRSQALRSLRSLRTSGAGLLMCGSTRRLEAWPGLATAHGHRSLVLRTPNVVWLVVLEFWGAPLCVVTNVVNRRCFSCGFLIRCYKRRQSDGFFAENQGFWTQIDDVCNRGPREAI